MKSSNSVSLFVVFLAAAMVSFAGAGCGGERCEHDTCEPGSEVDAVGAVPDTVAGGDVAGVDVKDVIADVSGGFDVPVECPALKPYVVNGKCVECRDCHDCRDIRPRCHPAGHFCDPANCPTGTHFCRHDCQCHECCDDSQCIRLDGTIGVCGADGMCEGTVACSDECGGALPVCARYDGVNRCVECGRDSDCGGALPVCATFDGVNHCVECVRDSDCDTIMPGSGCKCAPAPVLTCVDGDGRYCFSSVDACTSECGRCTGCPKVSNLWLECGDDARSGSGRSCYDSDGSCDGVNGCCAGGMKCHDLTRLFVGGVMGRIPGVPFDVGNVNGGRFCECAGDADCRSGLPCTDTGVLCGISLSDYPVVGLICPDGQLSPHMPARLCARPESLSDWAMSLSADCEADPLDEHEYDSWYGVCTVRGGIEQRVRCLDDAQCLSSGADCRCIWNACINNDGVNCDMMCGGACAATCRDDEDCGPAPDGNAQSCSQIPGAGLGLCVDPAGTCDRSGSCCAPGQTCYDMSEILQDLVWPDLCWPLLFVPVDRTYCGCDKTDDCLNGKECTDVSSVCDITGDVSGLIDVLCPGGTLDPGVPTKVCGSIDEFLAGHVKSL